MTVLAVDTTGEYGSVALRSEGRPRAEIAVQSATGFGHLIFAALDNLRNEANLTLAEVDCFAAAAGPGSFTGVRIGLSIVKGLSESTGKPGFAISNLRALSSFGKKPSALRAVVLDARRSQVYAAVYDSDLRLVQPETVLPFADWLRMLDPEADYEFISPLDLALEDSPFACMPVSKPSATLASAVALCAEVDALGGDWPDVASLDANYVRFSDAELYWRDV